MTDIEYSDVICPCGHPTEKHTNWGDGCFAVTNIPEVGELCTCMISSDSLNDLKEQLEKLKAYENPQNYAHIRNLKNAAADALACWMDEERQDELDHFMGALQKALENYKG